MVDKAGEDRPSWRPRFIVPRGPVLGPSPGALPIAELSWPDSAPPPPSER